MKRWVAVDGRDGMLALLGSILEYDRVHVYISGASVVIVDQGVSKGGPIGPLPFPCFMDTTLTT